MKTRVITGIVALLILVPFLIFSHTPAYTVFAVIVSLVGVFEMIRCQKKIKVVQVTVASLVYAVLTPVFSTCLESSRLRSSVS